MLPKLRKLSRRDLQTILQSGLSIKANYLTLRYVRNPYNFSRFAAIVSTKVFNHAHDRNTIRRHIYQLVTDFSPSVDVVIILYPQVVNLSHEDFDSCIHQVLSKIPVV